MYWMCSAYRLDLLLKSRQEGNTHLGYHVAALPAEEWLVEEFELQTQLAHIVGHTKTVRQGGQPIDDVLIGIGDEALAEGMLAVQDEIDDAAHRVLGEQCLLIQMNDPIVVVQHIHRILEAVLEGARLEQGAGSRLVLLGHDNLANASMLRQMHRLVRDDLDQEVLQAGVEARINVPQHILLDQVRKVAACDHTNADERRQQGAALEDNLLGEGIVEDKAAEIEQHLGQCEQGEETQ